MAVTWWMVAWLFVVLILELVVLFLVLRLRRLSLVMHRMQNQINAAQKQINENFHGRLRKLEVGARAVDF